MKRNSKKFDIYQDCDDNKPIDSLDGKYKQIKTETKVEEKCATPKKSITKQKALLSLSNRSEGKSTKVGRDLEKAKSLGHIINAKDLQKNIEYSLRHSRVTNEVQTSKNSRPGGLFYFSEIFDMEEHDQVVKILEKLPLEKRSPWSSEGFGGNYQKTYYVTDAQIEAINKYGYNWDKRRMKFQTSYNPEKSLHPGECILKRNLKKGWPKETLTERIVRLLNRPGYTLDLLAVQANWMRGTHFPTHRDHARHEGWGDVIVSLSVNSGGHIVFKRTASGNNDMIWAMHVGPCDVYSMRSEVRWDWEHGLVADDSESRISLIWRFRELDNSLPLEQQPTRLDFQ